MQSFIHLVLSTMDKTFALIKLPALICFAFFHLATAQKSSTATCVGGSRIFGTPQPRTVPSSLTSPADTNATISPSSTHPLNVSWRINVELPIPTAGTESMQLCILEYEPFHEKAGAIAHLLFTTVRQIWEMEDNPPVISGTYTDRRVDKLQIQLIRSSGTVLLVNQFAISLLFLSNIIFRSGTASLAPEIPVPISEVFIGEGPDRKKFASVKVIRTSTATNKTSETVPVAEEQGLGPSSQRHTARDLKNLTLETTPESSSTDVPIRIQIQPSGDELPYGIPGLYVTTRIATLVTTQNWMTPLANLYATGVFYDMSLPPGVFDARFVAEFFDFDQEGRRPDTGILERIFRELLLQPTVGSKPHEFVALAWVLNDMGQKPDRPLMRLILARPDSVELASVQDLVSMDTASGNSTAGGLLWSLGYKPDTS